MSHLIFLSFYYYFFLGYSIISLTILKFRNLKKNEAMKTVVICAVNYSDKIRKENNDKLITLYDFWIKIIFFKITKIIYI